MPLLPENCPCSVHSGAHLSAALLGRHRRLTKAEQGPWEIGIKIKIRELAFSVTCAQAIEVLRGGLAEGVKASPQRERRQLIWEKQKPGQNGALGTQRLSVTSCLG